MRTTHVEKWEESKVQPGKKWKPTEEFLKKVTHQLAKGSKSYTDLNKKLKWSDTTLSNCLRWMEKVEHSVRVVKTKPKAKRVIYELDKNNPVVAERLKFSRFLKPSDTEQPLDEKGLVDAWKNLIDSKFANLLEHLTWKDQEKAENEIKKDLEDFADINSIYSELALDGLKAGDLKADKIREIQTDLHIQLKKRGKK